MYKGHDRAIVEFKSGGEEAEAAGKKKCVVSATEACYRIFAYELHANLPHVLILALHLENQQPVYFLEQAELDDVLSQQSTCMHLIPVKGSVFI